MVMQYQQPRRVSAEQAAGIFRSGDVHEIVEALIATSLYLPDRAWVESWLIHFSVHANDDVRRAAALSLGNLARLHGRVSPQAVAAVTNLLEDPGLSGAATDALEDVEIFTREDPKGAP
jgi:hypothetical protein